MEEWKKELDGFFKKTERASASDQTSDFAVFITNIVVPAFEEFAKEMEAHGRNSLIRSTEVYASITITCAGEDELSYRIQGRRFPNRVVPYAEVRARERKGLRLMSTESALRTGPYQVSDVTKEDIVQNMVTNYTRRVQSMGVVEH